MKKKIIWLLFSCILSISLGCASPYIGKTTSWNHYLMRDKKTHRIVSLKHIILNYDYYINTVNNTISFDGTINCNNQYVTDWDSAQIKLTLLFIDKNNVVVGVERWRSLHDDEFCTPKTFKAIYPYKENYYGVRVTYSIKLWQ